MFGHVNKLTVLPSPPLLPVVLPPLPLLLPSLQLLCSDHQHCHCHCHHKTTMSTSTPNTTIIATTATAILARTVHTHTHQYVCLYLFVDNLLFLIKHINGFIQNLLMCYIYICNCTLSKRHIE